MIWVTFLSFKNDSYRVSLTEIWGTRGCWGSGFSGRGYVLIKRKRVEDVYFKALIKRKRVFILVFLISEELRAAASTSREHLLLEGWDCLCDLWGVDSGSPPESPLFLRGCNDHLPSNSRKMHYSFPNLTVPSRLTSMDLVLHDSGRNFASYSDPFLRKRVPSHGEHPCNFILVAFKLNGSLASYSPSSGEAVLNRALHPLWSWNAVTYRDLQPVSSGGGWSTPC